MTDARRPIRRDRRRLPRPRPGRSTSARRRRPSRADSTASTRSGGDRREQAARGLRVVGERHELGPTPGADVSDGRDEAAVVGGAAGLDAGRGELERAGERRQRGARRRRIACREARAISRP